MTTKSSTNITNCIDNNTTMDNRISMSKDTRNVNMNYKLINNSIAGIADKLDLKIIRELSLCFNNVMFIPNSFPEQLINLEKLDFSNNNLEDLPSSFGLLSKLEHLKMDYNKFQTMPAVLAEIRSLKFLSMSHNTIDNIPEELGTVVNLEVLNLSYNKLLNLPNSFVELNRLKELNLASNNFEIIPECVVYGMRNLEILNVSVNLQIKLNVPPCSKRLIKFYAMKNGTCRTFPIWVLTSEYSSLEEINFNQTEFIKFLFPKENVTLNVKVISFTQSTLSDNILEMLTKNMRKLEKLIVGNDKPSVQGNVFCNVPFQKFKSPQKIKEIYMKGTGLPMVVRSINTLTNIKLIDFSNNTIAWLPDEFCHLKNLEVLIINDNNLSVLPDDFGNLVALKILLMSHNHLSILPNSMSNLKELSLFDLFENDLSEVPWSIVKMEKIIGLDIDNNFISTKNLMIRSTSYEVLRTTIRGKYASSSRRGIGARIPPEDNEYSASEKSVSSFKSENYSESDEIQAGQNDMYKEEENWDLSDDSTEEFEPTSLCRKKHNSSYVPTKLHSQFFCPEDLHAIPVKQEVRLMRGDKRQFIDKIVEGQFDDAE